MKCLITGITGFTGPHLAKALLNLGHEVVGLIRCSNGREVDIDDTVPVKDISFLYGDISNLIQMIKLFNTCNFDCVYHLAAQSHPPTSFKDPYDTFYINSVGTVNIAEAIALSGKQTKLMFCSTSEVYGVVPEKDQPISEKSHPVNPMNPYGVSKASADMHIRERAVSTGLPFFCTRAFSNTGPRRGHKFSIASDAFQIAKILEGLKKPTIQVGNLSSRRVVADVRDVVQAYIQLMDAFVPGEAYNVGGENLYSMGFLLDKMLSLFNLKAEKIKDVSLYRAIDIPLQICNVDKLKKACPSWKCKYDIDTTLKDLVNYWRKKVRIG